MRPLAAILERFARAAALEVAMRAREPVADGFVDLDGVKLHWERFGEGEPTLLLLPSWTVLHKRSGRRRSPTWPATSGW